MLGSYARGPLQPTGPVIDRLTVSDLAVIEVTGSGEVEADDLLLEELRVVTGSGAAALPPTQILGGAISEMLFGRSSTCSTDIAVDAQGDIQSVAVRINPRFPDDPPAMLNPSFAPDGGWVSSPPWQRSARRRVERHPI